ncbi:unnamed protein product [Phyllotreta striolata]|uniref:Glutathione-dependent dehydroascorbate reductase n=1 Tax=Phyllotreta striolata TaxID=444603 RepID=A0A9N9TNA2_PHYSR|nr:unnamed protein product [Phyllotreta striolata]
MSEKHLGEDSVEPPRVEGLLRIYSMKYCPYAQRSLLVLKAKKLPHDVVNINLMHKPDWYLKMYQEGKVPTLLDGSKFIIGSLDICEYLEVGSLDICEYLEEKYPEPRLYPSDPAAKENDKRVIKSTEEAQNVFGKCIYSNDKTTPQEWSKLFMDALQPIEKELTSRGTPFFAGDSPGMVDYMIWPWMERSGVLKLKYGEKIIVETDIPNVCKWKLKMLNEPVCKDLYVSGEAFWKHFQPKLAGKDPIFDLV